MRSNFSVVLSEPTDTSSGAKTLSIDEVPGHDAVRSGSGSLELDQ